MENAVLDAIYKRRSVRAYTDEPVDDSIAQEIGKAALAAPSGMNRQPWKVIAVQNKNLILELEQSIIELLSKYSPAVAESTKKRGNKIFYNASLVYFLAMEGEHPYDIGIMSENIALAAAGLGLGSVILGLPRIAFEQPETASYWKQKLGFPESFGYGLAVAVGHTADQGSPHAISSDKLAFIR